MLRGADPAAAARLAEALKRDELGKVERAIERQLSPLSASDALQACWALQAEGKEAEGLAILKECARRGVPLPFDP